MLLARDGGDVVFTLGNRLATFDDDGLQAQLQRLKGSEEASRAGADNDHRRRIMAVAIRIGHRSRHWLGLALQTDTQRRMIHHITPAAVNAATHHINAGDIAFGKAHGTRHSLPTLLLKVILFRTEVYVDNLHSTLLTTIPFF